MDVGNLGAAGEFAAVTDGEINRSDNHARCTCRRKETNEQTHNRQRVIYANHLDAIMTDRSGRSQNYLAKLVTSSVDFTLYESHHFEFRFLAYVIKKNCVIKIRQDMPLKIVIIYFRKRESKKRKQKRFIRFQYFYICDIL